MENEELKTENGKLKKYKLGELCNQDEIGIYGIPATAEEFSEEKIRYLRITDISDDGILLDDDKKSVTDDNIEKYILQEGDIVFARTGNSTGRAYLYDKKDGILAFAGFLIKYGLDKNKVNPKFLRYYTIGNTYKQWVKNLSVGSTRGNISAKTFAECPISLPDRKQQDFTVDVLSSLDDKIALIRRMNVKLEQMAKRLYDHWFVQFDFPNADGTPYKASGGKMVWNETLKRMIPEGWEVKKIDEFCRIFTGKKDVNQSLNSGKYKFYSCAPGYKFSDEKIFEGKAILISGNGSYTGRTIFVNEAFDLYQRTYAVVLKDNLTNWLEYIFFTVQRFLAPKVGGGTHGSAIPYIVYDDIAKESFAFSEELVAEFGKIVIPILSEIVAKEKETQKLTALRDRLLPLLMNGQVEVR